MWVGCTAHTHAYIDFTLQLNPSSSSTKHSDAAWVHGPSPVILSHLGKKRHIPCRRWFSSFPDLSQYKKKWTGAVRPSVCVTSQAHFFLPPKIPAYFAHQSSKNHPHLTKHRKRRIQLQPLPIFPFTIPSPIPSWSLAECDMWIKKYLFFYLQFVRKETM